VVRVGGLINIQAWALEQEDESRRKFPVSDVFVPFNAQPKYLRLATKAGNCWDSGDGEASIVLDEEHKSTAQIYSEILNADFDDQKGLVVFQRYCHLYRRGELEEIIQSCSVCDYLEIQESGFESGNHFVILKVVK
jgi:hypothetical protein